MHCVRHQCELQMLAPLLPYVDVITLRVYYTGADPLVDATYSNPTPLRSSAPSSTSQAGGKVIGRQDARKLRANVDSLWQLATVWVVSFSALFWLMVRAESCPCMPMQMLPSASVRRCGMRCLSHTC